MMSTLEYTRIRGVPASNTEPIALGNKKWIPSCTKKKIFYRYKLQETMVRIFMRVSVSVLPRVRRTFCLLEHRSRPDTCFMKI